MLSKPQADLKPNSEAFENTPLVKPTGFREYDARWWFGVPGHDKPSELNLLGVQALGQVPYRLYLTAFVISFTVPLLAAGSR